MTVITLLPTPPSSTDPLNFDTRADEFLLALPNFGTEANTVASEINANAATCTSSAASALSSSAIATAAANFKGTWASLGTGSVTRPASVYHNSKFWVLLVASIANASTSQPGVSADWAEISNRITRYTYANRSSLRGLSPADSDVCIVEDLGLFSWFTGSTEVDDDETCFATASGRWLLVGSSPEYVKFSIMAERELAIESAKSLMDVYLLGSSEVGATAITAGSTITITIDVPRARPGDIVVAVNNTTVGGTAGVIFAWAYVSNVGVVTAAFNCANDSVGNTLPAGTYAALVYKGNR